MQITIYEEMRQFTFEDPRPDTICRVVEYAYALAEDASQSIYVLGFEVDGRQIGDPLTIPANGDLSIRLGREDAVAARFQYGGDTVLWKAKSEPWACALMSRHWHERYMWWGVITDQRDVVATAEAIAALWPNGYTSGNLHELLHTVSSQRALALLGCEGSFIDGKVAPEYWDRARGLLASIAGDELDVADDSVRG